MKRSDVYPMPPYFDQYINATEDITIMQALDRSLSQLIHLDLKEMESVGDRSYAPGKWTIKEVFQHLADVERIFCYRALLIARNDTSITPGFDQDFFANHSRANARNISDIIGELIAQRYSTIALFKSFDNGMLMRTGLNWKYEMNVLGFGFCIAGHQVWHLNAIKKNYLK